MKKQLLRVKQLADQTFSRADKTQVLTDDLQDADRRVEYIRIACQKTSKLLSSGLVTQGQDPAAKEKRLKKYPEYALSVAMSESVGVGAGVGGGVGGGGGGGGDSLLRTVLAKCGQAQLALANEAFGFELNVEQKVVAMLAEVVDNEIPSILKHKHRLQKLILDMDSARTRLATANKQSGGQRGEAIREELEEAELKVEQCRDALASEMFELISREADFAQAVVLHMKLQQEYHRSALNVLDEVLPELEADVQDSACKPVFHFPLEDHLRVTNRRIAFPLELCVCALLRLGTQEEGLFRVAGGSSKVRRLKLSLDAGCLDLAAAIEYADPHVLAAALKSYLRELPEPLATFALYPLWMLAAKETEQEARLNALWAVLHQLPKANFENLRYLIKFLAELTKSQGVNKMSAQNVAIVIAPNLLWSPGEESASIGANMNMASAYTSIVDTLISFCDWFFPEPLVFYQTWEEPKDDGRVTAAVNGAGATARITAQDEMDYYGHVRGGSHDTVLVSLDDHAFNRAPSTGSLSDSPPPGSPKPATRRKNKPAPGPPSSAPPPRPAPAPAATLPRPPKKPLETEAAAPPADRPPHGGRPLERNNALRRSLDLLQETAAVREHRGRDANHGQEPRASVELRKETGEARRDGVCDARRDGIDVRRPAEVKKTTSEAKKEFVEPHTRDTGAHKVTTEAADSRFAVRLEDTGPGHVARVTVNCEPSPANATANATANVASFDAHTGSVNAGSMHTSSVNVGSANAIAVANGGSGTNTSTLERKRPVAAPRCVAGVEDEVTLRRAGSGSVAEPERASKPAIPERPSILQRPNSLSRTPRHSAEMDALPDAATLERIHMYSVDKQQVSIVQVGAERDDKTAPDPAAPAPHPDAAVAAPAANAEHTESKHDRPERPPKPDPVAVVAATTGGGASHDGSPPSPGLGGGPPRPPRPQPPPPPAKPRPESDSTDL